MTKINKNTHPRPQCRWSCADTEKWGSKEVFIPNYTHRKFKIEKDKEKQVHPGQAWVHRMMAQYLYFHTCARPQVTCTPSGFQFCNLVMVEVYITRNISSWTVHFKTLMVRVYIEWNFDGKNVFKPNVNDQCFLNHNLNISCYLI